MPSATVNGTRLDYVDTGGDGATDLLLHAFPLTANMWEPQIEALSDRFRFIVPTLEGFGSSDAPEDESTYTMDAFADDAAALLDELGLDKVVLAGLSMGGYIAFAFLRRHRDRVS